MSPPAIAAVWVAAGVGGAALLPPLRLRRFSPVIPALALIVVLIATVVPATAVPTADSGFGLTLDRTAQGVLAASAGAAMLYLALTATVRGPELRSLGLAGAAAVLVLASPQPTVWAMTLVVVMSVLVLRWVAVAPGRATLAAGRVGIAGAAALLAASPFLPLAFGAADPTRPLLVGALVAVGVAILSGAVPLGGWAFGALSALPPAEAAAWPLLLAPAVLLSASRIPAGLPPQGVVVFGHILLVVGLVCGAWQGVQAARSPGHRYTRVFLADLGLALAAVGTGERGLALSAVLLAILTHAVAAPLLLGGERLQRRERVLAWALLSGLPPSPTFWSRLVVIEAMTTISSQAVAAALLGAGTLSVAALLAIRSRPPGAEAPPPALPWPTARLL
ncbi:MAG: hypothetical protein JOY68_09370, partial [Candidatus Dormibacteraeota bacterium]|nr:hypothetical protein [Candidatus Dormibacteraeota bacterium]